MPQRWLPAAADLDVETARSICADRRPAENLLRVYQESITSVCAISDTERWLPGSPPAPAGHTSVVTVLDRCGDLLPSTEEHVADALDEMAVPAARRHAPTA